MTEGIITKFCGKCKENLPASGFSKCRRNRDGLQSHCKACQNAFRKAHYAANSEKEKAYRRDHYAANREKEKAYSKAHYAANREKILEQLKADYADNREKREKRAESNRKWREENPGYHITYQKAKPEIRKAADLRRRARKAENGGTLTGDQIKKIVAQDCFWCGTDCAQDFHLDHIVPISKGGRNSRCNIAVSCPSCNLSKGAKSLSEWLREIGWVKP